MTGRTVEGRKWGAVQKGRVCVSPRMRAPVWRRILITTLPPWGLGSGRTVNDRRLDRRARRSAGPSIIRLCRSGSTASDSRRYIGPASIAETRPSDERTARSRHCARAACCAAALGERPFGLAHLAVIGDQHQRRVRVRARFGRLAGLVPRQYSAGCPHFTRAEIEARQPLSADALDTVGCSAAAMPDDAEAGKITPRCAAFGSMLRMSRTDKTRARFR